MFVVFPAIGHVVVRDYQVEAKNKSCYCNNKLMHPRKTKSEFGAEYVFCFPEKQMSYCFKILRPTHLD